ncbi:MotE family protein [Bacillus sinesaloumensis]|uniref:MotE family protein n=1 Tax=Litchfieldia sinesaloumensis TaxID=1926280 RepID=UPI0009885F57|nr:hypothetical protein [Bacillus sinesaloumensis]
METNEREYSKLQWLLFVVLIPTFFTLIVVFVLLSFAGFNPIGAMKEFAAKVPIISTYVNEKEAIKEPEEEKISISDLEAEIQVKENKITQLESELETKSREIQTLNSELENLSNELIKLQEERLADSKSLDELTKMYEMMSPKNAAKIIPKLNENEAREILTSIDTKKLAAIFEKMSPEDAAKFTQLITQ